MGQYREFITAVEQKATGGPEPVTYTLGKEYVDDQGIVTKDTRDVTFYPPQDGQVMLMMARLSRHSSTNDKIAGIVDFFVEIVEEDDHEYIVGRLMDRKDSFGITQITELMTSLMEEWGKRPTK